MTDAEFDTLEVEAVLTRVLEFCLEKTQARSIHWLSVLGMERVLQGTKDNWHWSFAAADVIGKHVVSLPDADMWDLFHVWRKVGSIYSESNSRQRTWTPRLISFTPSTYFVYPVSHQGLCTGYLLLEGPDAFNPMKIFSAVKLEMQIAAKYLSFAYQLLEAKNSSYVDELTGLFNQRYLPMVLDHELQRAKRESAHFTLLFLDIDYFKMINDGKGHWVGSKLLTEVAKVLKSQIRTCDYGFRYGGDEFIILLTNSNSENSKKVAERVRSIVESHEFFIEGQKINLTVSVGLASYPEHAQSTVQLIRLADQAMYHGKRKSRNVVFVAS